MIFKDWTSEKIFLLLAAIVGGLLIFLTPPMCTPDENTHFLNAYSISHGDVFPEVVDGQMGRYINKSVVDFVNGNNTRYMGNLNEKYNFSEFYLNSWLQDNNTETVFYSNGSLMGINPIGYIPASIGMLVGRLILRICGSGFDTAFNMLIFGRIFNLLFYIIIGYYAIKIAPYLKRSMLILFLLPMSLFLGASVSYDAILIPVCTLYFANTMKIIHSNQEKIIDKVDILITVFCTFVMFGIKLAYAPLLLLLICIPKKKFVDQKKYFVCIGVVIVTAMAAYLLPKLLLNNALHGYVLTENERITLQREYLFSNLGSVPSLIGNTIVSNISFYVMGFFGILGQLDTNFPLPFMMIIIIIVTSVFLFEICSIKLINIPVRVVSLVCTLLILSGMFYQMYINWTPIVSDIGASVITGVQGRYFLPMIFVGCIPLFNNVLGKRTLVFEDKKNLLSEIVVVTVTIATPVLVLLRFWI